MARELAKAPETLFWYWITERHAIYLRRKAGKEKPWTDDPILRDYKFTNPFRENDRGTVWLRENFLEPHRAFTHNDFCASQGTIGGQGLEFIPCDCRNGWENLALLAFNICWYRMFNWWQTGKNLGWQTKWNPETIKEILYTEQRNGRQVFTGAHIVYSPPGFAKIDAIVDVCTALYKLCCVSIQTSGSLPLPLVARQTRKLEAVFNYLTTIHCVGGFMAYEMVTDMRHTRLLEDATDIMTWANPGPGAKRGLQRLGLSSKPDTAAIKSMQRLLSNAPQKYSLESVVNNYEFPVFEMRDIEHSLCEFDKYCRVKFEEGEPRSKYPGGE